MMNYHLHTFSALNRDFYVAELLDIEGCEDSCVGYLSAEELIVLGKRKRKKAEYIFSRYIVKKVAGLSIEQASNMTVKYCAELNAAGIFLQKTLKKKLSLSHSGQFVAFSFCELNENVGIDIEILAERKIKPLIEAFFSAEDQKMINAAEKPTECFYQLWTEKEAVTKLMNTSIFTLMSTSSIELQRKHSLHSEIGDDYAVTIARDKMKTQSSS